MRRRFVNMIVHNFFASRPYFSLHRINPWRCFYPTTQQALAAADAAAAAASNKRAIREDARLPRAAMSFCKPRPPVDLGNIYFMSLGHSSNEIISMEIISMDQDGNTLLCEAASRAIRVMPAPHEPKVAPISLVAGNTLYLLSSNPGSLEEHPFEALIYPGSSRFEDNWHWRSLPPPPFASFDCYKHGEEEDGEDKSGWNSYVLSKAYTVVDDSQIWISTVGGGTYSFNTRNNVWSKVGEWELPFYGRVEYAPEHGLWFGFSSQCGQFAASDIVAASATRPPMLQKVWDDELAPPLPERWIPMESYLQPLGAGKFCIVRTFDTAEEGWCPEENSNNFKNVESFAVFTGVEVERGSRGALRMIKHKSRRYSSGQRIVETILF